MTGLSLQRWERACFYPAPEEHRVTPDIVCSNGVIHVTDTVLAPKTQATTTRFPETFPVIRDPLLTPLFHDPCSG